MSKRETLFNRVPVEILLGFHSILLLFWFLPEMQMASIYYNDAISHIAIVRQMEQTWLNGGNILDFWMANINLGHALSRSYQFLMHFFVWVMHKTLFSFLPLETTFNVCATIAVLTLPWTIAYGARLLGLKRAEAVVAAIALTLFNESAGYGVGLHNFTFSGYGIYTQLFALVFFPLAIGYSHRAIRQGSGLVKASVFFALTLFSHILVGYFAALWLLIDAAIALLTKLVRFKTFAKRTALFVGLTMLWTSFWIVPLMQDYLLQHKSAWEPLSKFMGLGASKTLELLQSGQLTDANRTPYLAGLGLMGFFLCASSWFLRSSLQNLAPYRALAVQTVAWFFLSFGPETLGFLHKLPFSANIHWHRAFLVFQFSLALCIGVAIHSIASALVAGVKKKTPVTLAWFVPVMALGLFFFSSALLERSAFFRRTNTHWLRETKNSWNTNLAYKQLLQFALDHPETRFNAGTHPNMLKSWGNELKATHYIPLYGLFTQFNVETVGPIYHHQNHTEDLAFRHDWTRKDHNALLNVGYVVLTDKVEAPSFFKEVMRAGNAVLYSTEIQKSYFSLARTFPQDAFSKPSLPCADNAALVRATVTLLHSPLLATSTFPAFELKAGCDAEKGIENAIVDARRAKLPAPSGNIAEAGVRPGKSSSLYWAKGESEDGQSIVFKMNYHPNWLIKVNGIEVPKRLVSPAFMAAPVPKGPFTIEAEYIPGNIRLVLAGLILALCIAALIFRKRVECLAKNGRM